jgi:hypothetical protein
MAKAVLERYETRKNREYFQRKAGYMTSAIDEWKELKSALKKSEIENIIGLLIEMCIQIHCASLQKVAG